MCGLVILTSILEGAGLVSPTKRGTFFGFEGNGPVNGRSELSREPFSLRAFVPAFAVHALPAPADGD